MKIGYFCNTTNWKKKPYTEILDNARDIAIYCDKNNWNSIWFTEHHFNHEGMESCPNPLMLGTDIAARTKQIRIGQACNVITFWNPIRLAEDIATLDHLSKGRVEVGIGRGVYGREAVHMNVEADLKDQAKNKRLFEETLTIMKKAWTKNFFDHQGEFYTYPSPGSFWGKPTWGTWWAWDARLTSMIILLLFYIAYILAWKFIDSFEKANKVSSIIGIIGLFNLPIIKYSVDWWNTLHQPSSITLTSAPSIHYTMLIPLIIMLFGMIIYSLIIFLMRYKTEVMKLKLSKKKNYK